MTTPDYPRKIVAMQKMIDALIVERDIAKSACDNNAMHAEQIAKERDELKAGEQAMADEIKALRDEVSASRAEIATPKEAIGQVILLCDRVGIDWVDECPLVGTILYAAP